jgi:superfamily I DNA/RNA helicase
MAYDPTPEQRLILAHEPGRHGRVLAGPGTGKSATVVDLVRRLLARDPTPRIRLLHSFAIAALLDAHANGFEGIPSRGPAEDLVDRTLAWLDAHPVPTTDEVEHWGEWLVEAFADDDSPQATSDVLAELLGVVDGLVEPELDLARYLGQIQPLARDHASAEAVGVRFLSLGMSKGLTVEASIIIGAEEGIIPDPRADEDEERRLLYVGLTRAKQFTYVTWAGRRTGPTARAGEARVQQRRLASRLLRGGPVQTQNGQSYVCWG